jgi:hypothetical protein
MIEALAEWVQMGLVLMFTLFTHDRHFVQYRKSALAIRRLFSHCCQ